MHKIKNRSMQHYWNESLMTLITSNNIYLHWGTQLFIMFYKLTLTQHMLSTTGCVDWQDHSGIILTAGNTNHRAPLVPPSAVRKMNLECFVTRATWWQCCDGLVHRVPVWQEWVSGLKSVSASTIFLASTAQDLKSVYQDMSVCSMWVCLRVFLCWWGRLTVYWYVWTQIAYVYVGYVCTDFLLWQNF